MEPKEYSQWNLKWKDLKLPMVPDSFRIKSIKPDLVKKIRDLIKSGDYKGIIVGTDSDVEGNGIYALLEKNLHLEKMKAYRFFETDLTDKGIMDSFKNLTDFHTLSLIHIWIINVPRRGIGAVTIKKLKEYAFRNNCSLYDAACSADEILSKTAADKLKGFAAMLRKMTEESKYQTADMTIKMILNKTNFFADYPQKSEELEERTENVYELINMATDYSRKTNHEGAEAIEGFLTKSALTSGIDSLKDDEDGVVLMTLHGSKGLEFPHVFMAGMEENTFPGYRAKMCIRDRLLSC